MSLDTKDLFRIEVRLAQEAGRIRRSAEHDLSDPNLTVEAKIYAKTRVSVAEDLETASNLICGMQADWDAVRPLLLRGYAALQPPEPPAAPSEDDAA